MNPFLEVFLRASMKCEFITELFIAVAMYAYPSERKDKIVLRVFFCIVTCYAVSCVWGKDLAQILWLSILRYIVLFLMVLSGMLFCFHTEFNRALSICISAYATQHITVKIYHFIDLLIGGASMGEKAVIYLAVVVVCYSLFYFFLARRMRDREFGALRQTEMIALSAALVFCLVVLSAVVRLYEDSVGIWVNLVLALYAVICCIFILGLQCGMFDRSRLEMEKREIQHILQQEKKQMEFTQETMDLVNIKCHDLKHLLSRYCVDISDEALEALKSKLNVFGSSVKTGNEVLNVVLAEKCLYGEKHGVKFALMADGAALSFMPASDIYSLFGNLLDNAVEAVSALDDPEKRYVSMLVKQAMGFISIHVENFFEGECLFQDGLPVTTKADGGFHGYGMKSIQMLVGKYNGELQITAQNGVFRVNILLPMEY